MKCLSISVIAVLVGRAFSVPNPLSKCNIQSLAIPGAEIASIDHYSRGANIRLPNTVQSCGGPLFSVNATTNMCRIVFNVHTTNTSTIRMEAWLPDEWDGRFLATANGGIGGCIDYPLMQNGAHLGFAAFGTNAGHDGDSGYDFFLNHPETINDWGYRAVHVEAVTGKQVISHYGRDASKSYYHGCSTGGRQGLQTANLYPEDFDGILVGSPGIDWLRIVASKGILARRIGWPFLNSRSYVRPEQWKAIVKKQIELFDPLDGVTDGIIDDPTIFRFDPSVLACGTGELDDSLCLTPQQIPSVRVAYQPLTNSKGDFVYPSFEIGSDTSVFSSNQVNGTAQLAYRVLDDFWRGAVYNDSTWTSHNFEVADLEFALKINPGGIAFDDKDLSEFYKRGSKVLAYHGRSDQTITSALSSEYYLGAQEMLNLTVQDMNEFYRLFFILGMTHCAFGAGAWNIGQVYPLNEEKMDSKHNALLALVDWVEKGAAPETLVGSKYTDNDMKKPIVAERAHCPYPYRSVWDGTGDTSMASSWKCQMP